VGTSTSYFRTSFYGHWSSIVCVPMSNSWVEVRQPGRNPGIILIQIHSQQPEPLPTHNPSGYLGYDEESKVWTLSWFQLG